MYAPRVAVLAVVGVVALTATGVRIGAHATFVNVVIDFNGRVPASQVEFDKLTPTMATFHIAHPGITTRASEGRREGVHVALQPGTQALNIAASFAPHRFKYVSYSVDTVRTGKHLVIGLWTSAPPPAGGVFGYRQCLSLRSWHAEKGSISVSGTENGVFEHTFQVVVRGASGRVLGRQRVVEGGSWSTEVKYTSTHRQAGTLEAVAFSPKDGALACLNEARMPLPAS